MEKRIYLKEKDFERIKKRASISPDFWIYEDLKNMIKEDEHERQYIPYDYIKRRNYERFLEEAIGRKIRHF